MSMWLAIVTGLALTAIGYAGSAPEAAERPCTSDPAPARDPALFDAAIAYVREQTGRDVDVTVDVVAADPDFAQLDVQPTRPGVGAKVFMKRDGARWIGVEMGIVFRCRDLAGHGFPSRIRYGCE